LNARGVEHRLDPPTQPGSGFGLSLSQWLQSAKDGRCIDFLYGPRPKIGVAQRKAPGAVAHDARKLRRSRMVGELESRKGMGGLVCSAAAHCNRASPQTQKFFWSLES
jgi:hypothetical protein